LIKSQIISAVRCAKKGLNGVLGVNNGFRKTLEVTSFMKQNSVVDAVANGDATAVNFANRHKRSTSVDAGK
jgi:hypothetical protein